MKVHFGRDPMRVQYYSAVVRCSREGTVLCTADESDGPRCGRCVHEGTAVRLRLGPDEMKVVFGWDPIKVHWFLALS